MTSPNRKGPLQSGIEKRHARPRSLLRGQHNLGQLLSRMKSHSTATAVSAPGKVLLAGGYLVVDRAHTGLVFGLSARIHVHVEALKPSEGIALPEIIVRSPQFKDAEWRYGYRVVEENGGIEVIQLKGSVPLSVSGHIALCILASCRHLHALYINLSFSSIE